MLKRNLLMIVVIGLGLLFTSNIIAQNGKTKTAKSKAKVSKVSNGQTTHSNRSRKLKPGGVQGYVDSVDTYQTGTTPPDNNHRSSKRRAKSRKSILPYMEQSYRHKAKTKNN